MSTTIVLPADVRGEIWFYFWMPSTHLVLCLLSKAVLAIVQSLRFLKRLQTEGSRYQRVVSKLPMAIPMLVTAFNHSVVDIEMLTRALCPSNIYGSVTEEQRVAMRYYEKLIPVHPKITDAPLKPKDLLPGLLSTMLNSYIKRSMVVSEYVYAYIEDQAMPIPKPLIDAENSYNGEVLIPLAEKDVEYD